MNVAIFAVCGIVGVIFLSQGMRIVSAGGTDGASVRRWVMWLWVIVYAFVGSQMAWTLRPFIDAPSMEFELFRQLGGSFYTNVFASIGKILGFLTVRQEDEMSDQTRSTTDQILDLLLDALAERQAARHAGRSTAATGSASHVPDATELVPAEPPRVAPEAIKPVSVAIPAPGPDLPSAEEHRATAASASPTAYSTRLTAAPLPQGEPKPGDEGWEPPARLPSINMGKMLLRLAILVAVLIAVVNILVNKYDTSLAHIPPESQALVIRDGLVLKGSGPRDLYP